MAGPGPTKPAAGVIATKPANMPDSAPKTEGFLIRIHSAKVQLNRPAAADRNVVTRALGAKPPLERALPALNPNQPNHKRAPPIKVNSKLWGGKDCLP